MPVPTNRRFWFITVSVLGFLVTAVGLYLSATSRGLSTLGISQQTAPSTMQTEMPVLPTNNRHSQQNRLATINAIARNTQSHNIDSGDDIEEQRDLSPKKLENAATALSAILDADDIDKFTSDHVLAQATNVILDGRIPGTSADKVRCSRRFCEVTFSHDDANAIDAFSKKAPVDGPWTGRDVFALSTGMSGKLSTRVFFSLDELSLPIKDRTF